MNLRAVEKPWRALWMGAITRALPGPRTAAPPDWESRPYSVLFLRHQRIGDMIMATSLLREIAGSHPTISLDVLATSASSVVLDNNPHVRSVLTLEKGKGIATIARRIRANAYNVIVDGRINNPEIYVSTPLLMLASGARYRVGAGGGRRDLVYNLRVAPYDRHDRGTHFIEVSARLAEPFGVEIAGVDWRPQLFMRRAETDAAEAEWAQAEHARSRDMPDVTGSYRLLVNFTAGDERRRWPDDRFASVISAIRKERGDLMIIVMGALGEWHRVKEVASQAGVHAAPTPTLRSVFAMVERADLVFTPDTSVAHAASAFNRPCVVMLMDVHAPYAPYGTPGRTLLWSGESIRTLRVETVLDALRSFLEEFAPL